MLKPKLRRKTKKRSCREYLLRLEMLEARLAFAAEFFGEHWGTFVDSSAVLLEPPEPHFVAGSTISYGEYEQAFWIHDDAFASNINYKLQAPSAVLTVDQPILLSNYSPKVEAIFGTSLTSPAFVVDRLFQDWAIELTDITEWDIIGTSALPSFGDHSNLPAFAVDNLNLAPFEIAESSIQASSELAALEDLFRVSPSAGSLIVSIDHDSVSGSALAQSVVGDTISTQAVLSGAQELTVLEQGVRVSRQSATKSSVITGEVAMATLSMSSGRVADNFASGVSSVVMAKLSEFDERISGTTLSGQEIASVKRESLETGYLFPFGRRRSARVNPDSGGRVDEQLAPQYRTLNEVLNESGIDVDVGNQLSVERAATDFSDGIRYRGRSPKIVELEREGLESLSLAESTLGMLTIGGEMDTAILTVGPSLSLGEDFIVQSSLICDDLYHSASTPGDSSTLELTGESTTKESSHLHWAAVCGALLVCRITFLPRGSWKKGSLHRLIHKIGSLRKQLSKKSL